MVRLVATTITLILVMALIKARLLRVIIRRDY